MAGPCGPYGDKPLRLTVTPRSRSRPCSHDVWSMWHGNDQNRFFSQASTELLLTRPMHFPEDWPSYPWCLFLETCPCASVGFPTVPVLLPAALGNVYDLASILVCQTTTASVSVSPRWDSTPGWRPWEKFGKGQTYFQRFEWSKTRHWYSVLTRAHHRGEPLPPLPPKGKGRRESVYLQDRAKDWSCGFGWKGLTNGLGAAWEGAEEGKRTSLSSCLHLPMENLIRHQRSREPYLWSQRASVSQLQNRVKSGVGVKGQI